MHSKECIHLFVLSFFMNIIQSLLNSDFFQFTYMRSECAAHLTVKHMFPMYLLMSPMMKFRHGPDTKC